MALAVEKDRGSAGSAWLRWAEGAAQSPWGRGTADKRGPVCLLTLSFCADECHMVLPLSSLNFWLADYFCYVLSP